MGRRREGDALCAVSDCPEWLFLLNVNNNLVWESMLLQSVSNNLKDMFVAVAVVRAFKKLSVLKNWRLANLSVNLNFQEPNISSGQSFSLMNMQISSSRLKNFLKLGTIQGFEPRDGFLQPVTVHVHVA